ncbi:putative M16-family peptidase [Actinoplanes missouriensis 431]|uniref:Putative M16-family peptidase n=1 Tax=Actinoplanes missouriensis (strain ATCC 14538 / DSM 43046 / CBS 188.64 / JCM 3121 / NBRC 102363 / NCIMB 12654 / NRRL B-3342 / UNCC 431) TaxID=512565 RepID=I0HH43_ACTM4|nr:pitrilysin family protein [Actinoplanes missouriensis]BAL92330.1 putative M16-family peptidase [Actinoplanes missouriensis 431]
MTLITERPLPGTARPYTFPQIRRAGNVIAAHLPGQILASAVLLLDASAARETEGREGTATVLAKSLEEGTKKRDSAAYALALEGLGAELSPSVDWDTFRVGVSAPAPMLADAVRLAAEAARTPRLDPSDVARVRDDEVTALRMDWAQPGPRADAALRRDLFAADGRYSRPLHGDPASVAAVTVEDVLAFHEAWMLRPGVLLVAGDLDALNLDALAEAAFAGTSGDPLTPEGPLGVPVRQGRRTILVDRPGSVQSTLRIGHRAPERATPDYVAMTLAATVLGGAFTSRLNHLIREVKGYTYGIRGSYGMTRRAGRFEVAAGVQTAVTGPAVADTLGEIRRTQNEGVTEAELEVARSWRAGQLSVEMQTPGAIAGALSTLVVHGLPDDYYETLRREYLEATVEQVSEAAARHLSVDGLTLVVEGDAAVIRDDLAEFGELVDSEI